jgi:hypothetical protein
MGSLAREKNGTAIWELTFQNWKIAFSQILVFIIYQNYK